MALNLFSNTQQPNVQHKRVVIVRNPIDSFASLVPNGWVHHNPGSFDEYCRRYLLFLTNFEEHEIFRYEDFVADPAREMTKIAGALSVPHNELFEDIFDVRSISGDSGRKSSAIGLRSPCEESAVIAREASASKFHGRFLEIYGEFTSGICRAPSVTYLRSLLRGTKLFAIVLVDFHRHSQLK